jgi:hypothetical protein
MYIEKYLLNLYLTNLYFKHFNYLRDFPNRLVIFQEGILIAKITDPVEPAHLRPISILFCLDSLIVR